MNKKVLIAGEHFPILNGLKALTKNVLGKDVEIDIAQNYQYLLEYLKVQNYDLLISDLFTQGIDGLSLIESTLQINPDLRILIVSLNPSSIFAPRCIEAGAIGYICTTESEDEFKKAIWQTYMGKRYVTKSSDLIGQNKNSAINNPFDKLSKQEFSVLLLLLEGHCIKEVSNSLNLKISTVSTYRMRILNKLKLNNLMELSRLAAHFRIDVSGIHTAVI